MQTIKCNIQICGYNEQGFCLSPLVVIDDQGRCKYLSKAEKDQLLAADFQTKDKADKLNFTIENL